MKISSQTPRRTPKVQTRMVEWVLTEAILVMSSVVVNASASAEVAQRRRSSEVVVHVTCTVLEGQGNCYSTRNMRSEGLAG